MKRSAKTKIFHSNFFLNNKIVIVIVFFFFFYHYNIVQNGNIEIVFDNRKRMVILRYR